LRVVTPLADGYAALTAIAVVIVASVWWSRRRRPPRDST